MNLAPEDLKNIIRVAITDALNIKVEHKATLTIAECSKLSGIGKDKLMELAHNVNSDFPCFKVGKKFLVNREMLMIWLEKITKEGRTL